MLRPPDDMVFIDITHRGKNHVEAVILAVGKNVTHQVGSSVGIIGKIEKLDIQGETKFSTHEKYIAFEVPDKETSTPH